MKPLAGGMYELVILDGLKSKTAFNSNDPPNSFHTHDMFVPHPSIPGSWKHVGRLDDCVTLMTGEKVLPMPIENRIRQDSRVKEAVVIGVGRAFPGLLVFKSEEAENPSELDYREAVWTAVEDYNSRVEGSSKIGQDMIVWLPATRDYPQTDKGTVIRAQLYEAFATDISALYERGVLGSGAQKFEIDGLEDWLVRTFRERFNVRLVDTEQKIFTAGVDSVQISRMLGIISLEFSLYHISPSTSAVYDTQNIQQLARYLHDIRHGKATRNGKEESAAAMIEMIKDHSHFDQHVARGSKSKHKSVFITGANGFLGSHILAQVLEMPSIARVYCQVRASSPTEARSRLLSSLAARHIEPVQDEFKKVYAFHCDINSSQLPPHLKEELSIQLTHIIHCAWPVNFNLPLSAFKEQFRNLQSLLQFSLATNSPKPIHLVFCSSVSAALNHPSPVPERPLVSPDNSALTGYGQSKFVAEKIIQKAVENAGANATILRIGQVVGDTLHGIWNDNNAIPIMVRSSLTTLTLPAMDERCAWLPVDTAARSVIEFAGLGLDEVDRTDGNSEFPRKTYVFNLVNPKTFSWTDDFVPILRANGLSFEIVSPQWWLQHLREGGQNGNDNPAVKLMSFWSTKFGWHESKSLRDCHHDHAREGSLTFDTVLAQQKSLALRNAPDVIAGGLVLKMLGVWMGNWRISDIS
ncbi:putative secondary metabolism biosynthetic enzyme [Lepraria neglecta]|uniref:Secondary metabolism biosynthetic enzyme n=1 Tax=Lepraria neglecta TaxID=209136 RepID=A0AAD9ZGC2_9LECA|nr:putative secondary metabolism biosynthetic enzyme [Lepraria neglecta]